MLEVIGASFLGANNKRMVDWGGIWEGEMGLPLIRPVAK